MKITKIDNLIIQMCKLSECCRIVTKDKQKFLASDYIGVKLVNGVKYLAFDEAIDLNSFNNCDGLYVDFEVIEDMEFTFTEEQHKRQQDNIHIEQQLQYINSAINELKTYTTSEIKLYIEDIKGLLNGLCALL